MKILVVSFNYSPMVNPRSLRVSGLCEAWASLGHEVHILASNAGGTPSFEKLNNVNVHRVGASNKATVSGAGGKESSFRQLLKTVYRMTFKNLIWPDSNFKWIKPAVKKCIDLEAEHKFDHIDAMIVVFGSPGLMHVKNVYDVLRVKMEVCEKPIYPVLPSLINAEKEINEFISVL